MNKKSRHSIYIDFFKLYTQHFKRINSDNVQQKVINLWKSLSWEERIKRVNQTPIPEKQKQQESVLCGPEELWNLSNVIFNKDSNMIKVDPIKQQLHLKKINEEDDIFAQMGSVQKKEKPKIIHHNQYSIFFKAKFEEYKKFGNLTSNEITKKIAEEWRQLKQLNHKFDENSSNLTLSNPQPKSTLDDQLKQKLSQAVFFIPVSQNIKIELKGTEILDAIQQSGNNNIIELNLAINNTCCTNKQLSKSEELSKKPIKQDIWQEQESQNKSNDRKKVKIEIINQDSSEVHEVHEQQEYLKQILNTQVCQSVNDLFSEQQSSISNSSDYVSPNSYSEVQSQSDQ